MEQLITALLLWIATATGIEVTEHPKVAYVSYETMAKMYCEEPSVGCSAVQAMYDRQEGIVYLHDGFDIKSLEDQSTLVHELTHHVQQVKEMKYFPCLDEMSAYAVADVWRREHGLPLITDEVWFAIFMGSCIVEQYKDPVSVP